MNKWKGERLSTKKKKKSEIKSIVPLRFAVVYCTQTIEYWLSMSRNISWGEGEWVKYLF